MKLTTLLLIVCLMQVSAKTFSQISINVKNAPLETVLETIKQQSGYVFVYDGDLLADKTVTVKLNNVSLNTALEECFKNLPLTFKIVKKNVAIQPKEQPSLLQKVIDKIKERTISGDVRDTLNVALGGATIRVKGKEIFTTTNPRGSFKLDKINTGDIIVVSYIGYQTREINITDDDGYFVRLVPATNKLDQVVIQAYGVTTQRLTTGNIAKVTAEEIARQPVMNPLLALQGKVAGLDVTQTSGYASAPVKVELRGRNSLNDQITSDPLYIIDGVPLTVLEVGGASNYNSGSAGFLQNGNIRGPAGGQSPFFNVNPGDIESIEVLKDADALAIYGSRGANGVILVTTKKGKAGKTKVDAHVDQGISRQTRFYQLMNTQQYLAVRKEAFKNDGIDYTQSRYLRSAYDLVQWDPNRYTDWQKELYGGTGKTTDASLGISGGSANTTFRIGLAYNHSTSILTASGADQRGTLSANINHSSTDQKFTIALSTAFSFTQSDMVSLPGNFTMPPNAPAIYDANGNLNFAGWGAGRNQFPFGVLKQPYDAKTNLLNTNLVLGYKPFKGFSASTSIGYNIAQANQEQLFPIISQDPINNPTGTAQFGNNSNKNLIIEPQLSYTTQISKGKLSLLLGASYQTTTTDGLYVQGTGYTNDALLGTISNAPTQLASDNFAQYRYAAIFGRINYNWDDKYLLNISGRRDGSSKFGAGKQFGNFGAIGAAWIFTQESFFKENLPFLSFGKIRSSYGITGSDGVGDYQYLSRWSSENTYTYNNIQPLVPLQHANPNFQWQANKKLEAAIDLGFLNDRFLLSAAYYRDRVGNQLIDFPIPEYTGFSTVTANSPALVQNKGLEFVFSAKIIKTKDFDWSMNFNTSFNRNKLLAYPNLSLSPYANRFVIGQPLNIVKLLHYTGVDPQTGYYTFEDKNHDGKISNVPSEPATDDRYVYDLSPKFIGGGGMNFSYKALQLSFSFNIKKQIGRNVTNQNIPGKLANQPASVIGTEWQKPGDIATTAKFTTIPGSDRGYGYFSGSDAGFTDASFIRLSNLSLNYSVPSVYAKKLGLEGCSVFLNTNNLFTITRFKGIDPEVQNFGGLPPSRIIVLGLSLNL
ncbi:SusC/RagA family TonB-linked outer membrane protein [Mucilaginibacter gracilis]|nr:SusC/RagA family TonB-linked outer membrane protein [Mucilaginibacter gracilis]